MKSLFDANSILAADADNTPTARTISEEQIVARLTGGSIAGLTVAASRILGRGASGTLGALTPAQAGGVIGADLSSYHLAASTMYDGTPPCGCGTLAAAAAITIDQIYLIPFYCPQRTTWTQISIYLATAQAAKGLELGIYTINSAMVPTARLLTTGPLSVAAGNADITAVISHLPVDTLFGLAVLTDGNTATFRRMDRIAVGGVLGATAGNASPGMFWTAASAYAGGLPDPFPAATVSTTTTMPRPMLKTSATP